MPGTGPPQLEAGSVEAARLRSSGNEPAARPRAAPDVDEDVKAGRSKKSSASQWTARPGYSFQLLGIWKVGVMETLSGKSPDKEISPSPELSADDHANVSQTFLQDHVGMCGIPIAFPSSTTILVWDAFGAVLIIYDLCAIPLLSAFNISSNLFVDGMNWTTLIFWTINVGPSLHVGYVSDGVTVMNQPSIIKHYVKTWFVVDLVVLAPDWLFTIIAILESTGSGSTGVKLLRFVRLFRMARLIRLMKLGRFLEKMNDLIDSEYVSICTHIGSMMMRLMTIWHIIACTWFGISYNFKYNIDFDEQGEEPFTNWIDIYHIRDKHWSYQYATCYHWAIAQFTPAPSNIQPQNPNERVFAIAVLIFALLGFAYVVGSITGSLAQLRVMKEQTTKMFWGLRRYLKQRKVSMQLSNRIQRYLAHAWAMQQAEGSMKDNRVFQLLSEQLRSELHCELAERHLRIHPFFRGLSEVSKITMNRLSTNAVQSKPLARADSLFINGEMATHMYIVGSGVLQYLRIDINGNARPEKVEQGDDWIAEPVLWVEAWEHLGCLVAETHCELCLVTPKEFAATVSLNPVAYALSRVYAQNFFEWLASVPQEDHSDIWQGEDVSERHKEFLI